MDDLISRAALLNDLSYCPPELWQDEEYIKVKIIKQPVVDAVPVIRCQSCKHYGEEPYGKPGDVMMCYCGLGYTKPIDYCSRGERREDE